MKNCLFLSLFCAFTLFSHAQSHIQFSTGSWSDALAEAKKQQKLIFLDAYTGWCAPCKRMAKEVFTDPKVSQFYNEHFVNISIDMEKDDSEALSDTYGIVAYPTLLFVNGDGKVAHRALGYYPIEDFIELGKTALDPNNQLSTWKQRYEQGERSPEFLKQYILKLKNAMAGDYNEVANAYLDTQSDWSSPENQQFIIDYVTDFTSKPFDYFLQHRTSFEHQFGTDEIKQHIDDLVHVKIYTTKEATALKEIDALYQKLYPADKAQQLSDFLRISFFREKDNKTTEFTQAAIKYYNKYDTNDAWELNDLAWTFYETVSDENALMEAIKWAKKSIKLEKGYDNYLTLGALYHKIGKKNKSKKYLRKAIKIAEKNGDDATPAKDLLKK